MHGKDQSGRSFSTFEIKVKTCLWTQKAYFFMFRWTLKSIGVPQGTLQLTWQELTSQSLIVMKNEFYWHTTIQHCLRTRFTCTCIDLFFNDLIDRRIYLNLSKSTESSAGLKALKPAANGRYLINVLIITLFTFTVQKYIILLSVMCMLGLSEFS